MQSCCSPLTPLTQPGRTLRSSPFCQGNVKMSVTAVLQQHNMFVLYMLWRSDLDTMTHVSAGAQRVFLATCSCVCVHVCVCCVSSHLAALMPALRMCGIGLRNNLFLSVSMCLFPLDPYFPSLSLFLPNTFHPPVSLHPSFVYRTLLSISLHLSSLPSFHPSLHPGASSVTFYLWHIMHVLLRRCQRTDGSATMCVIWLEEGEREGRGGGQIDRDDHPLPQMLTTGQSNHRQLCCPHFLEVVFSCD